MNSYLAEQSILVLDNTYIHQDQDLIKYIEAFSSCVEFLPSYSSDFNPIKTCFSIIKSFLKKYRDFVHSCNDPKYPLLVAYSQITLEIATNIFRDLIYI